MHFQVAAVCAVFIIMIPADMASAQHLCPLPTDETGIAEEVIDGDTIRLKNGLQVRLVGIQAPKLPLGRANFKKWPLADEARKFAEELVRGKTIHLHYGGRRRDRHGRALAHVTLEHEGRDDPLWLQWEMVNAGLARVYSFSDNRSCLDRLFQAERDARKAGLGIWGLRAYQILTAIKPGKMLRLSGSFQLVEGKIESVSRHRKWVFINFDKDWKQDFTIAIPAKNWKLFQKAGFTLSALKGKKIRVRGWLGLWNGPMIEADHPEQIERLGW